MVAGVKLVAVRPEQEPPGGVFTCPSKGHTPIVKVFLDIF